MYKHTIVNFTLSFALGMPVKLLSTRWSNTTHMLLQSRYPLAAEATTTIIRTYPQIQYERKFCLTIFFIALWFPEIKQIHFISQFTRWSVTTFRNLIQYVLRTVDIKGEFISNALRLFVYEGYCYKFRPLRMAIFGVTSITEVT